ncbi:fructosamine kinase family protein [Actinoplanes sp. KI2]|uniref:fructosamine kinase family protein n=1 Tax=Actinoplanes sp. KI2 TaxID=2983315 RepID=UPI0021D6050E|nr:fructosamine kinase family protein [Actinoplanes sp. KI2]MCU7722797.1 fructosamine kinase family protein [Actinoplanes sp. KI2]
MSERWAPSVAAAVSRHLGEPWRATGFTDLGERASHPCGIFHGEPISVFAKLNLGGETPAELRGLELLRRHAVAVPKPIAEVRLEHGTLVLLEAIPEIPAEDRTPEQWASIGHELAKLHRVRGRYFGLVEFDGYFGPLPQDNRPAGDWPTFYGTRRLAPLLRRAVDAGRLDADLAKRVERLIGRLPEICGPQAPPALLHGDAQQNNFLTGKDGAYLLDVAPYYGHPEIDLALLDYFAPVPPIVFDAYRAVMPIDRTFGERRELWRLFGYLAVVTVEGDSQFGRPFVGRIAAAVARYV